VYSELFGQEIDPETGTSATIQSGVWSLRGKKAIYSLTFFDGQLIAGGTNVEGVAVKVSSANQPRLVD
jgi:hypothetical protein